MKRNENIARSVYAVGLIALSVIGLTMEDFIIARPPPCATDMAWLFVIFDVVVIAGAIGIITRRYGYWGSIICGVSILLFSYAFKIIPVFEIHYGLKNR